MKQILIILVTICIILYSANVNAYGASKYDNEFDDTDVYDEEVDCPEGFFFQVYPHGQCYPKDPTIWRKERTTYIPYRNKYVCKPGYLNLGIDQCWTRVNSAYDELMEEENDKDNNKLDTDMDYEDDDAEEDEFNGRKLKKCGKKCKRKKKKEQDANRKEKKDEQKAKRLKKKKKDEQKAKRLKKKKKDEQKAKSKKKNAQQEAERAERAEKRAHNEAVRKERAERKAQQEAAKADKKALGSKIPEEVEKARAKYLVKTRANVNLSEQMQTYINDKVTSLKPDYERYVCKKRGWNNQSPNCWNKHGDHWGGDNNRAGKECAGPSGCWLLDTPGYTLNNEYKEDSKLRTFEDFKKNVLSKWHLSNNMKEELEEKLMPMLLNWGPSRIFEDHVFIQPKKGTGEWFLEIISVDIEDIMIKKIVYLKLHSKAWLLKPKKCAYPKKGGGKRYCSSRGYEQDEIDIISKTLELKAFEMIQKIAPRKGGPLPCTNEFNCFCYQDKNKGEGIPEDCVRAMLHYDEIGREKGYDGTCCAKGAVKVGPKRPNIHDGDNLPTQITYRPKKGISDVIGMCDKYDFNSERNEITVSGSCSAVFNCNGAPVKCESVSCSCGDDVDHDRRRLRRLKAPRIGVKGEKKWGIYEDHNTKLERYSTCASECNAPNPMADPLYWHDRRRLRRRRLTPSRESSSDIYNTCVDCISRCMGCTKTCQCPTDFIWTHNR